MKRVTGTFAALLSLVTIASPRPAAQQLPSGAGFHLVEAAVQDVQLALRTGQTVLNITRGIRLQF